MFVTVSPLHPSLIFANGFSIVRIRIRVSTVVYFTILINLFTIVNGDVKDVTVVRKL